jgi:hypothetical protein
MTEAGFYLAWGAVALLVALVGMLVGREYGLLGIIVDGRGRCSLTKLQVMLWTVALIPLFAATAWQRGKTGNFSTAIDFPIPSELLSVLGISVGSAATSAAVKSYKDSLRPDRILVSARADAKPHFSQVFMEEEGALADKVVDVGKFQNFWITLLLVGAYIASIGSFLNTSDLAKPLTSLPGFSDQFVTLLLISHAGYVAGKIPNRPGTPPSGLTLDGVTH